MDIRNIGQRVFYESTRNTILRFSVYTFVILLFAKLLPWVVLYGDSTVLKENGTVEWLQLGLLLTASFLFFRESRLTPRYHHALVWLACLSAFAGFREMDANLDRLVPWIGWKIGFSFILYAAVVTYSNVATLKRQIMRFLHFPAFSLLWTGFVIAVPFAQLVGHGAFLQTVMEGDYSRDYKRMIEELGELMGYALLFIGSFELIRQINAPVLATTDRDHFMVDNRYSRQRQ